MDKFPLDYITNILVQMEPWDGVVNGELHPQWRAINRQAARYAKKYWAYYEAGSTKSAYQRMFETLFDVAEYRRLLVVGAAHG